MFCRLVGLAVPLCIFLAFLSSSTSAGQVNLVIVDDSQEAELAMDSFKFYLMGIIDEAHSLNSSGGEVSISTVSQDDIKALWQTTGDFAQMLLLLADEKKEEAMQLHENIFSKARLFHQRYNVPLDEEKLRIACGTNLFKAKPKAVEPVYAQPAYTTTTAYPYQDFVLPLGVFAILLFAAFFIARWQRKRKAMLCLVFLILLIPSCLAAFNPDDMLDCTPKPGNVMKLVWGVLSVKELGTEEWRIAGIIGNSSPDHSVYPGYENYATWPFAFARTPDLPNETIEREFVAEWVVCNNSTNTDQGDEQTFSYLGASPVIAWAEGDTGKIEICIGSVDGSLDFSNPACRAYYNNSDGTDDDYFSSTPYSPLFNLLKGEYLAFRVTGKLRAARDYYIGDSVLMTIYLGKASEGYFDHLIIATLPIKTADPDDTPSALFINGTYNGKPFVNGRHLQKNDSYVPLSEYGTNGDASKANQSFTVGDYLTAYLAIQNAGLYSCDYKKSPQRISLGGNAEYFASTFGVSGQQTLNNGDIFYSGDSDTIQLLYPGYYRAFNTYGWECDGENFTSPPGSWFPYTYISVEGPAIFVGRVSPQDLIQFGSEATGTMVFTITMENLGTVGFGPGQDLPAYVELAFLDSSGQVINDASNPYLVPLAESVPASASFGGLRRDVTLTLNDFSLLTAFKTDKIKARAVFKDSDILALPNGSEDIGIPADKFENFFKPNFASGPKYDFVGGNFFSAPSTTTVRIRDYFAIDDDYVWPEEGQDYTYNVFLPSGPTNFEIVFFNPFESTATVSVSEAAGSDPECDSLLLAPSLPGSWTIPAASPATGTIGLLPKNFNFDKPSSGEKTCKYTFSFDYAGTDDDAELDVTFVLKPTPFDFAVVCDNCFNPQDGVQIEFNSRVISFNPAAMNVAVSIVKVHKDNVDVPSWQGYFNRTTANCNDMGLNDVCEPTFTIDHYESSALAGARVRFQADDGDTVIIKERVIGHETGSHTGAPGLDAVEAFALLLAGMAMLFFFLRKP